MEFQRKFGKRKRSNPRRGIMLVILLFIVLILWFYAESLIERLFS
ncbi:hypothetical protein [Pseudotenacibaculum haliotis]|uniref:Uncharacterized protein n=1 Tax=Pseudotenacibaculum haliotis TaxID=1862138 RepID=A0ABW5LVD5_9FLAO